MSQRLRGGAASIGYSQGRFFKESKVRQFIVDWKVVLLALIASAMCTSCAEIRRTQARYAQKSGVEAYHQGKLAESLADFDRSIALDPENARARANRGGVLAQRGETERALVDLDEAIRLDPKDAGARMNRCRVNSELKRALAARADCDEALRLEPLVAAHWRASATQYSGVGKFANAIADVSEAIRLDPLDGRNYALRCRYRRHLKQDSDAWADCDRAVALTPTSFTYHRRALVARDMGNLAAAAKDLDQAIHLDSTNTAARADRIALREWMGDIAGSISDARALAEMSLVAPFERLDRAYALFQLERYAEARDEFELIYAGPSENVRSGAAQLLAALYAMAPEDRLRDGKRAMFLAQEVRQLAATEQPSLLQVLAAANAELGNFDEAVRLQERAIPLMNVHHEYKLNIARKRLALYQQGKPYRYPPLVPLPSALAH